MTETGPTAGGASLGSWRHRPRPARSVRIEPEGGAEGQSEGGITQPPPEACPSLYLASEPNARAAFVTDAHRCELRQEIVPGPGHQLGYCLTTNHVSCPQLRTYEVQRQAGVPIGTPPPAPEPAGVAAGAAASSRPPATPFELPSWLGRGGAAALGALGAIVLLGALALLYSSPGNSATAVPPIATAAPQTQAPQPAAAQAPAPVATPPLAPTPAPPALAPAAAAPAEASTATDTAAAPAATAAAEPTPAPAAGAQSAPLLVPYIVQPGDTLLVIAATYNVNLDELLRANELVFNSPIYHGQQLLLPIRVLSAP